VPKPKVATWSEAIISPECNLATFFAFAAANRNTKSYGVSPSCRASSISGEAATKVTPSFSKMAFLKGEDDARMSGTGR